MKIEDLPHGMKTFDMRRILYRNPDIIIRYRHVGDWFRIR